VEPAEAAKAVYGYDPATKPPRRPEFEPLTDVGNAARFTHRWGHEVRYVPSWGWLLWDQTRWRRDETANVMEFAKETARSILDEAKQAWDDDQRKALAKHAIRSESAPRLKAMIDLAASDPAVVALVADFDTNPFLLNAENGVINLKTGALFRHARTDLITKTVSVSYDPDAECPRFETFLQRILADPDLIKFVQRAAGYCLTGSTAEQVIFMLWGLGANGKSTLLELLRAMLGEYALSAPVETFILRRDSNIPNDLARLQSARFVTAVETDARRHLAESLIKSITGGDTITARFLYSEFFEFQPAFKLWLATNHRPRIRGTDHAIWRRVRLIPFTVTIPDAEQDRHLVDKLKAELPGILRWAVNGCLAWQRDGLGTPKAVEVATAEYRAEQDPLAAFIAECCVVESAAFAVTRNLYQTYSDWCDKSGEHALTLREFGEAMTSRGFLSEKGSGGVSRRRGIGLLL
jgi:putative DNA primase/helicase